MAQERVTVEDAEAGERLDRVLAARLAAYSRTRLKHLVESGQVMLEGATITDPSLRVKPGQSFTVAIPPPVDDRPTPQAMALAIVYEDEQVLVLDKPAGLVVHPAPGNPDKTLVNALLAHCGDSLSGIGGVRRPGIVHRLDKDTSGVMVVAKNDATHHGLSKLFAAHDLTRIYQALVWGAPKAKGGTIDAPIARHPVDRKRMAVRQTSGKRAVTEYWLEKRFGPPLTPIASLMGAKLHTGRTHQVRVHMAHLGCPVVGDPVYGRRRNSAGPLSLKSFGRQALHAAILEFRHPRTGREMTFATELPHDMAKLVAELNSVK